MSTNDSGGAGLPPFDTSSIVTTSRVRRSFRLTNIPDPDTITYDRYKCEKVFGTAPKITTPTADGVDVNTGFDTLSRSAYTDPVPVRMYLETNTVLGDTWHMSHGTDITTGTVGSGDITAGYITSGFTLPGPATRVILGYFTSQTGVVGNTGRHYIEIGNVTSVPVIPTPIGSTFFTPSDAIITFDAESGTNNPTFTRTTSNGTVVHVSTGSQFVGQINSPSNGNTAVRTLLGSSPVVGQPLALDMVASATWPVFETGDGAQPTSPVLSGTPQFNGTISVLFDHDMSAVGLTGGYFDAVGSTSIVCFDSMGNLLGQIANSQIGNENFGLTFGGANVIRGISFYVTGDEPYGFDIDNLQFRIS